MLLILLAAAVVTPPNPIVGRASVIDGDTLEIHGRRIRLWGIDAPEGRQTCTRASQTYRCGQEAANALDDMVRNRIVTCNPESRPDRYGRTVAKCFTIDDHDPVFVYDLAGAMVSSGHALDFPRYSRRHYARHEAKARENREGLWAGEFQRPWEWRAR